MRVIITGQLIHVEDPGLLVSGSVGQYYAEYEFSSEYDPYDKILVFERLGPDGDRRNRTVNSLSGEVEIPWEVLAKPGLIRMGAYGLDDAMNRPTLWSQPYYMPEGVSPGDTAQPPTILPWEELIRRIGDLDDLPTEDKSSIVAALIEIAHGSGQHIEYGETLKFDGNVLNVNTASAVEQDNTLPVTSAAVYTEVGNINALLGTI